MEKLANSNSRLTRKELLLRLEEADEALRAIRSGEVDALIVSGAQGDQVFTLKDAILSYQTLIEEMNKGALILTLEGMILYCNAWFAKILGVPMEKILGEPFTRFVIPAERPRATEFLKKGGEGKSSGDLTLLGSRAKIPVEISLKEMKLDDQPRLGLVVSQLTEHRQANLELQRHKDELERLVEERTKELSESEARFRAVLDNSPDVIYRVNAQSGLYEYISPSIETMIGFSPAEIMAMGVGEAQALVHPDDQSAFRAMLAQVNVSGKAVLEYRQRTKNGEYRWMSNNLSLTTDKTGLVYRDGNIRDITRHKKIEAELKYSNQKINEILSSIQDDLYVLDWGWSFVYVSRSFTTRVGKEPEDFLGRNIWQMFPNILGTVIEENLRAAMEKREIRRFETGGKYTNVWYNMAVFPSVDGITVLGSDITARKQAEDALRESEERLKQHAELLEHAPVLVRNLQDEIIVWNSGMEAMYGFSREDALGKVSHELLQTVHIQPIAEIRAAILNDGHWEGELQHRRKDGSTVTVHSQQILHFDTSGERTAIIEINKDITKRKLAEEAVQRSEAMLRAVLEQMPSGVIVRDVSGKILLYNSRSYEILGAELGYFDQFHPHYYFHPDGAPYRMDDWPILRSIAAGEVVQAEEMKCEKSDGSQITLSMNSAPVRNLQGQIVMGVGIFDDITRRKRGQEQLSAALKEKEVLLKEIHHRVKNNLQVISSLLRLQAARVENPQVRELFDDSQRRVRAMALIHEQLYQSPNLAQIDFKDYLHNLVNYLRRSSAQLLANVEIRVVVESVIVEMEQAVPLGLLISELVSNSMKHAFPSGAQAGEVWIIARREASGGLTLMVGDNGTGLPDTLDFENSSTMGLQLVRSFVTQLQGQLTVQRKPGTLFTVTIPERKV